MVASPEEVASVNIPEPEGLGGRYEAGSISIDREGYLRALLPFQHGETSTGFQVPPPQRSVRRSRQRPGAVPLQRASAHVALEIPEYTNAITGFQIPDSD